MNTKPRAVFIFMTGCLSSLVSSTVMSRNVNNMPNDFVHIRQVIPDIQLDMRYASTNNFIGRVITGYQAETCLLTKEAATALKKVQTRLVPMGLSLKVYDCYRPQMAVNDFVAWSKDSRDIRMKAEYYPDVAKKNLFAQGYIAAHSSHSRGSTMDLTIVPLHSALPLPPESLTACTSPEHQRAPDNSLDFGTGFDCFSPVAHPDYPNLSPQIKANRLLLRILMIDAGFKPLKEEWWHFTLSHEPYPDTYFNFPVK